jgi:hypothetical protein
MIKHLAVDDLAFSECNSNELPQNLKGTPKLSQTEDGRQREGWRKEEGKCTPLIVLSGDTWGCDEPSHSLPWEAMVNFV